MEGRTAFSVWYERPTITGSDTVGNHVQNVDDDPLREKCFKEAALASALEAFDKLKENEIDFEVPAEHEHPMLKNVQYRQKAERKLEKLQQAEDKKEGKQVFKELASNKPALTLDEALKMHADIKRGVQKAKAEKRKEKIQAAKASKGEKDELDDDLQDRDRTEDYGEGEKKMMELMGTTLKSKRDHDDFDDEPKAKKRKANPSKLPKGKHNRAKRKAIRKKRNAPWGA